MYLKKIAASRIKDGDFIIAQSAVPEGHPFPFRFQYSGTVTRRNSFGQFSLTGWSIEKFDLQGNHIRTSHKVNLAPDATMLLIEIDEHPSTSYFKVVL